VKTYKTMQVRVKKGHRLYDYFKGMCHQAKNMHNTTNFYIRQVFTGLTQDKALEPLQEEVLQNIAAHLPQMNHCQQPSYAKKVEKEKTKPVEDRKEIKCNGFEAPSREKPYVNYHFLDALFKSMKQQDYRALPTQTSQGIMKTVFQNWKSFYGSLREYKIAPGKFKARPNIPKYCRSMEKEVLFSNQDSVIKDHKYLKFPKTKVQLNIGKLGFTEGTFKQVRVIPKHGHYVVELVFELPLVPQTKEINHRYLSVDLGIDNLAAIVTNTGQKPVLIKGKNIKAANQRFNQLKAHYQGILRQGKQPKEGPFTSKRLEQISNKRYSQIKDLFHKASAHIEGIALEENIETIIIGRNKDWKQQSNMGTKNNQSFVSIPHGLLVQMITYKAERHGIRIILAEESYTSKASFLDLDDLPVYGEKDGTMAFSGKRVKRGLYRTKNGTLINADVNGAANIMRKTFERAFEEPFASTTCLLTPIALTVG